MGQEGEGWLVVASSLGSASFEEKAKEASKRNMEAQKNAFVKSGKVYIYRVGILLGIHDSLR